MSLGEIGRLYGCDAQTICNRFKEYNLKSRSVSESLTGRKIYWGEANLVVGRKKGCAAWNKGLMKATDHKMVNSGCPGDKHWAWKGGISLENTRDRQSSKYKVWRDKVFQRDNYICQKCFQNEHYVIAHHIKGFSEFVQDRYDIRNGITVCDRCHKKIHKTMRCKNE